MAGQKEDDQHEHTFSSYVRIRDVVLKTCLGRWTKSGERRSGISVLVARHYDDDDCCHTLFKIFHTSVSRWFQLKFEWQQVSSSFQDSPLYSSRSQQCCSLDGLHLSSYFHVLQFFYKSFGFCTKNTNYNFYHRHFHVPQFFSIL